MKKIYVLVILFCLGIIQGYSQYLSNPSFEGQILMIGPPPGWEICIVGSTPNVQPGKYAVYLPPSDGITYLGMLTRPDFTWEDSHSNLDIPLSKDSCYIFKIDLAFWQNLSFTTVQPCVLKIYGSNITCQKNNLLWQSPAISNLDWQTFQFMIHNPEYDITDLIIEAYFVSTYAYYGYVLMDNIRIDKTPFFDLGNDTTMALCYNDTLFLDPGSGFEAYLWQDGSTNQTYPVTQSGLYWVQAFNEQGCSYTDSIVITIPDYVPMATELLDSTLVCEGQPVIAIVSVVNGIPPYSYEWEDLPDTTGIAVIFADTTRFYTVTITDHCGYTIQDSIKLIVKTGPDIDLGADTLICIDGSYTLHAGSGYPGYVWQDGSVDSVLTIDEPGLYWVTVTNIFGCSTTDSINISLAPALPLDLGSDTAVCIGDTLILDAGEGYVSYVWQDNSGGSEYVVTEAGVYWVTITSSNGCTAVDTIQIAFLENPEVDLGEDFSICEGDQQEISAGAGFATYLWQDGSTGAVYTVTEGGIYWVLVNNGCGEDVDSVTVQMYPSPEPDLGPDTTICNGGTLLLDPGSQFTSYLWQDNSTAPTFEALTSGTYSVEVVNMYGCTASDEIYINVSDPQVNLGQDNYVCEGDSLILDAGAGFETYLWQDNSTNQTMIVMDSGIYDVTVIDQYGCQGSDEIEISLFPYPIANLGDDKELCAGDTVVLTAPDGDFDYYWNGQPGDQNYEVYSSGNYSLSVVNLCDSVSDEIYVNVVPVPHVYLGEDDIIIPGQSIELDAGSGFDSYLWQDGSGGQYFVITENNISSDDPYYFVEVTDGICKGSDTIKVELLQVWVPKVITLNGDGSNERFRAKPGQWNGIDRHKMVVFNRWGETVWESDDFVTGWDGKQNGKYVADGTYYWILDIYFGTEMTKQTYKGSLTVLGSGH
jgi:gliding motility-associated-like protein